MVKSKQSTGFRMNNNIPVMAGCGDARFNRN